jgi:hypothetical protein
MIDIDRQSYVDGDAASGMRYRFVGLSTETKPTSSSTPALAAGCEFYEQDTNRYFYFDGLSWRIRPPATLDDVLSAINALNQTQTNVHAELSALRLGMMAADTCREVESPDTIFAN